MFVLLSILLFTAALFALARERGLPKVVPFAPPSLGGCDYCGVELTGDGATMQADMCDQLCRGCHLESKRSRS